MEFPNAKWSFGEAETYMWGPAFLVHAITDSLDLSKSKSYETKLPSDASWFEFATGRLVVKSKVNMTNEGNFNVVSTAKTLHHIPVFVRSGSFIPMSPVIQSTDNYQDTNVVLHYYVDRDASDFNSSFTWYEDDGYTADAESKNLSKKLCCNSVKSEELCKLEFQASYGSQLTEKAFQFELRVHTNQAPKSVNIDGKNTRFTYDGNTQTLKIHHFVYLNFEQTTSNMVLKW
jgi:alpha-glucosidase (family GH31 glycosyl hydrolase)